MKFVYVSHPYTGDEKQNVKSARKYCRYLKATHPDWIIFNPLDNNKFMHKCDYEHKDYMEIDLEIIDKVCDIIVMCGEWQSSIGCTEEITRAKKAGLEIYYCKRVKLFTKLVHFSKRGKNVDALIGQCYSMEKDVKDC